jgi:Family of unknown function (DUF5691)
MSFGALLEAAMAGTERREPPATLPAIKDLAPARRLLLSASYEGMRRLAGRPLDPIVDVIAVEPCGRETLRAIPASAGARLLDILSDRPELLLEWLGVTAHAKWRVSPDCLPDLLEYARTRFETHDLLEQVGGERALWLANLNPDWQYAARLDAEVRIAIGTPQERVRALRRIRRQSAARGREILSGMWRSERAETRLALLDVLAHDLSAEDEPLLLRAVQDARKDVRDTGLRLIRRVPGSHFGQRWIQRARQLVAVSDAGIEVREPGEPDSEPGWIEDGLDPRPPKGMGSTAWILQQTLAFTPPSIWPHGMLGAIQRSDWSQPLLNGLGQAAAAYADAQWCEDLLVAWDSATQQREKLSVNPKALFGALAPARAEAVFVRLLDIGAPPEAAVALVAATFPWSEDFSRLIVTRLPGLIEKWQYAASAFLQTAPLRLDPRVLPEAERLLDGEIQPAWARPAVQRLGRTLQFRLAMRTELEPARPPLPLGELCPVGELCPAPSAGEGCLRAAESRREGTDPSPPPSPTERGG